MYEILSPQNAINDDIWKDCKEYAIQSDIGYIYALFDGTDLVYIGQSKDLTSRINSHKHLKENKHFTCKYFTVSLKEMNEVEAELILRYLPKLNKSLPSSKFITLDEALKDNWEVLKNKLELIKALEETEAPCIRGHYHKADVMTAVLKTMEV